MGRWFRFYDDAIWHPKVLSLRDSEFRTWVGLLSIAARENDNGFLPDETAISKLLGIKKVTFWQQSGKLMATGLLLKVDGRLRLYNWEKHQYKSDVSTERTRRFRRKGNVPETVPGTAPDTEYKKDKKEGSVLLRRRTGADAPTCDVSQGDLLASHVPPRPPINGWTDCDAGEKELLTDPKADFFRRGKQVLGKSSGGLLANLLRRYGDEDDQKTIAKARSRIEEASTKANPSEWIARVVAGARLEKTAIDPWGNPVVDWRSVL